MTGIFRDELQYMAHIEALRMFVLMRQVTPPLAYVDELKRASHWDLCVARCILHVERLPDEGTAVKPDRLGGRRED